MEIAVIGSGRFVLGFRLAGVRRTVEVSQDEYPGKLDSLLTDPKVGILVVSDEDVERLSAVQKRRLSDSMRPVVIPVGKRGEDDIRERIKRAIGIDLYKKD
jgi:V/A-type H+-transporting ATPase subunit F